MLSRVAHPNLGRWLLAVVLFLHSFSSALGAPCVELQRREPAADAPTQESFTWTSKGGLAYAWRLPRDYRAEHPVHLTLICH